MAFKWEIAFQKCPIRKWNDAPVAHLTNEPIRLQGQGGTSRSWCWPGVSLHAEGAHDSKTVSISLLLMMTKNGLKSQHGFLNLQLEQIYYSQVFPSRNLRTKGISEVCVHVWTEFEQQCRRRLLLFCSYMYEVLKAALSTHLHLKKKKGAGTEWCLKTDNDLHFNIMLSVACYCDKVLHVSLPNESGCSVVCATKTFGQTCHLLLFLVNEHGKSVYVLLQYTGEISRGWLGDSPSRSRDEPREDIFEKEKKRDRRGKKSK